MTTTWEELDISAAPTFACRNCRKAGVRVKLDDDWNADEHRAWRCLFWRCDRCTFEWAPHPDDPFRVDWTRREN